MQRRSSWKLPFLAPIFFNNKIFKTKNNMLRFSQRNSIISRKLVKKGGKVTVYSGKA